MNREKNGRDETETKKRENKRKGRENVSLTFLIIH